MTPDGSDNPADEAQGLKGQLLVSSRLLRDPNFAQAVVLLVQHGPDGALGVIINRPLELTVRHACEQVIKTTCEVEGVLHAGGPCEGVLMVVHGSRQAGDIEVRPDLFFSTERRQIEWLLENYHGKAKYFVGYAGWGPGQLEAEMESGAWLLAEPASQQIFDDNKGLWQQLMTKLTLGGLVDPDRTPDDPSLN